MAGTRATAEGRETESRAMAMIARHRMRPLPARCFSFRREGGGSAYGFAVTWSPGIVCLTGDLGTLTLRDPYALARFDEGMAWLADAEFDYLLGKAIPNGAGPDPDGTLERLVQDANAEARDILGGYREERATARKWEAEDGEPVGRHPYDEARRDISAYAKWTDIACSMAGGRDVAAGDVRSPAVRRRLKRDLARFLGDADAAGVARLCRDLGHDDWFGETRPDAGLHWMIPALRHAARELRALPRPEPTPVARLAAGLRGMLQRRRPALTHGA